MGQFEVCCRRVQYSRLCCVRLHILRVSSNEDFMDSFIKVVCSVEDPLAEGFNK